MAEYIMFHQVAKGHEDEEAQALGWASHDALLKDAEFPTLVGLWTEDHCGEIIEAEYNEPTAEISAIEFCSREGLGTSLFARAIPVTLVGDKAAMTFEAYENKFC